MVTIKQIAQEVGISSSTVSIVFGRQGGRAEDQHGHAGKKFCGGGTAATSPIWLPGLRGGSGANELVVAMFWAQDFQASMMFRFWDGLRAEIEKNGTSGAAGHLPVCQRPPEGKARH